MLYTLCIALILIAAVLIVLAILVQSPKSGMAANFGVANQELGVRQTADFLEKATWGLAVAILVLSLIATLAMDSTKLGDNSASKEIDALIENAAPVEQVIPQVEAPADENVSAEGQEGAQAN